MVPWYRHSLDLILYVKCSPSISVKRFEDQLAARRNHSSPVTAKTFSKIKTWLRHDRELAETVPTRYQTCRKLFCGYGLSSEDELSCTITKVILTIRYSSTVRNIYAILVAELQCVVSRLCDFVAPFPADLGCTR